jgi:hypothetical protein
VWLRFKSANTLEIAGIMASSAYGATDWIAEYSLSEPCGFTNIQDSPSIQFKTEFDRKTKPNRIIGFSIIVIGEQN